MTNTMEGRKEKEKKDEVLFILRKSRKAFITEYVCGGILIVLFLYMLITQTMPLFQYIVAGAGVLAFVVPEAARLSTRYKVMNTKIVIIKGFIQQNKKNVYFHPLGFVPDLNIKQGKIARLLNYGSIYLKSGSDMSFTIEKVDKPHSVLDYIEELIEKNSGKS